MFRRPPSCHMPKICSLGCGRSEGARAQNLTDRSITCPAGLTHTMKLGDFFFFARVLISLTLDIGRSTGVDLRKRLSSLRFLKYCIVIGQFSCYKNSREAKVGFWPTRLNVLFNMTPILSQASP
jgi:hypothetical protein